MERGKEGGRGGREGEGGGGGGGGGEVAYLSSLCRYVECSC